MAIHTFAAKQPVPSSASTSKNHHPAQSPQGRNLAPLGQPLNLQRKIGNRATAHLLAQQRQQTQETGGKDPGQQGGERLIQRFPTHKEVKKRSSKASSKISMNKVVNAFNAELSTFDTVIVLIKLYNKEQGETKVGNNQQTRQTQVNKFTMHLDQIQEFAHKYIAAHVDEDKGDRDETIESFKTLGKEIVIEKLDLNRIVANEDYNQTGQKENKTSWHDAVAMTARSNAANRADIATLITTLGLPLNFVARLDPNLLDNLVAADAALKDGNMQLAEATFLVLSVGIPNIWPLIKSALMRKHLGKINPGLEKALSPGFEHNSQNAEQAFGAQAAILPDEVNQAFRGFSGTKNLAAGDEEIKNEAAKPFDGEARPVGWAKDFKRRQAWEKKNVNLADYQNLQTHEQFAVNDYAGNSDPYNNALRGDVSTQGFDQDQYSKTLSLISALNKLPPYEGPVYRHDNLFAGFKEANEVGATTTDMAFMSTTKDASSLKKVEGRDNPEILIVLQSKTGRFIKPLSGFNNFGTGDENEVLFKPGVRFRITKRYDAAQGGKGPDSFPRDMDSELKSALDQDAKKNHIQIVLKKVEE